MTSACPLVALRMFIRIFIVVVFPAPLGPSRAYIAFSGTERFRPLSASTFRNCLTRFSVTIVLLIARYRLHDSICHGSGLSSVRIRIRSLHLNRYQVSWLQLQVAQFHTQAAAPAQRFVLRAVLK